MWNVFGDTDSEEKFDRNNNGIIDYFGLYFQLEYAVDNLSVFVQGSGSSKGFKRRILFVSTEIQCNTLKK